jgi:hypothetical protein
VVGNEHNERHLQHFGLSSVHKFRNKLSEPKWGMCVYVCLSDSPQVGYIFRVGGYI